MGGESTTATHMVWQDCPATAPVELYAVFGAPHDAAQTLNGEDAMITVMKFSSKVEVAHGGPSPPPSPPSPPSPPRPPSPSPDAPTAACQQCLEGNCGSHKAVRADC